MLAFLDLECVDPPLQLSGVNQRPQDVVVQITEPQGNATQVLQPTVDRLGWPIRCADLEARQDALASAPQPAAQLCKLLQFLRQSLASIAELSCLNRA